MAGVVIIGAGHAGCRAAEAVFKLGWQGPLHLINGEECRPYERPPLSKSILAGDRLAADVPLLQEAIFSRPNFFYEQSARVSSINRVEQSVTLNDGRMIPYQRLLIATGATARSLPFQQFGYPQISTIRTIADAESFKPNLREGARLVIIGGGLIGLEVAATARKSGCDVHVIEAGPRLLMRILPEELEGELRRDHVEAGVSFHFDCVISEVLGNGHVEAVKLTSGEILACDSVLVSVGSVPDTALAEACGLKVANGIVVDEFLRTEDPNVFAAGDVCCVSTPNGSQRLECWRNSGEQGEIAGQNMVGDLKAYSATPWMWSDQYDKVVQAAGVVRPGQDLVLKDLGDAGKASFHFEGGRLSAVVAYGSIGVVAKTVSVARTMLERGICPNPDAIATASELRTFLKSPATA